jgi:cell migration-inducing and hyaluronan-binding protein
MHASTSASRTPPANPTIGARAGRLLAGLFFGFLLTSPVAAANAQIVCNGGNLPVQALLLPQPAQQPDLLVRGNCTVMPGQKYFYANVNILDGGKLDFAETPNSPTDFYASSIIIENGGAMTAGSTTHPFGEKGGVLTIHIYGAASPSAIDINGNPVLTQSQGQGAVCQSAMPGTAPCGIPQDVWNNNGSSPIPGCVGLNPPSTTCLPGLPATASTGSKAGDYFYDYAPLYGDAKMVESGPDKGKKGYFGYKTLAVSFGGTLALYGYKGASYDIGDTPADHLNSGVSWIRLKGDAVEKATSLTLERAPGGTPESRWKVGDEIVVTTTDYLPGHSEQLTIASPYNGGTTLPLTSEIKWTHVGTRYGGPSSAAPWATTLPTRILASLAADLKTNGAETRAAVALLTRSIRIVSEGDGAVALPDPHIETFEEASARTTCPNEVPPKNGCYYFGAHMVVRQGFEKVQIQGVEFKQMGQGGRLAHYPVHFHKVRQTPPNTYVKDSSVNESMTRWYVIHSTQGVTLARNVGYKSIGHGYYLEDGTETDNNFYSDIGIFCRAAINNDQNPRLVPGILADNGANSATPAFPYRSDNEQPTGFWISNGWNNFEGDMAAGAGACGASYWFVPMANSDAPDVLTPSNNINGHMKWDDGTGVFGYAGLQRGEVGFAGTTPLKDFSNNYATSAYFSFQTTPDSPACFGFLAAKAANVSTLPFVREIESIAPEPAPVLAQDTYYPRATGARKATLCPLAATQVPGLSTRYNCSPPPTGTIASPCANGSTFKPGDPNNPENNCTVTVLDHYTSSFTWAEGNYSGIWLRPQWYLVDNSVITDPQSAGLTFISGGDFTRSSVIEGDWSLMENSVLIGHTQPQDQTHRFALDTGPFNSFTKTTDTLECAARLTGGGVPNYCLNAASGVSLPVTDFFSNQRLFSIYDGPAYEQSNAYLDVTTALCTTDGYNGPGGCIYGSGKANNVLKTNPDLATSSCYLPNAAIAWKQPNGFFYPPSFHSANLYFGNVGIRHFVIQPLFKAFAGSTSALGDFGQGGSYITDPDAVTSAYCLTSDFGPTNQYFNGFTGIDRQTELSDDDGTLTGLSNDVQQALTPLNPLKQTISINEDAFFTAPVETPECASNLGANNLPGNACNPPSKAAPSVTAKTSPYDYVATIVHHVADSNWSSTCSNPTCYGVPLYRQFLAGTPGDPMHKPMPIPPTREWAHWIANGCDTNQNTPKCRWPFIRMAGENIATRETLTVNNGTYYIDTAVPLTMQTSETYNAQNGGGSTNSFSNVFVPGETYTVFFAYAKNTTRQTYQIYLGASATADNIKSVRVTLDTTAFAPTVVTPTPAWLPPVDTSKVASNGIVSVTVDFTKLPAGALEPTADNGMCQPHGFCTPTGADGACESTLAESDPRKTDYDAVCGQWAVKDLDCPRSGCYGFTFTIPSTGFNPIATPQNPTPYRLQPVPFPTDNSNQGNPTWLVKFLRTTLDPDATTGQCHYTTLPTYPPPGTGECTVPDWVPAMRGKAAPGRPGRG